MARLIRKHADSGALAGFGLCAIAASVLLSLVLGLGGDLRAQSHTANLPEVLQNLLSAVRVGS